MEAPKTYSWYKDAVFYEVHVRAFADSGEFDGIGDFRGLAGKLDYLQNLGITALWVLPFYPSPLKDDGYDISDYMNVHPDYGTLSDFNLFLKKAHQRGLKVITELVLNHTSDAHAWFQRARRSPLGSAWRNFYVWSDTPTKYGDARVIFKDFETSNWTWDPIAKAYYWHRFYSHQPDLNYDNPEVQKTMFKVVDFWLEMGVDGLRLDAVPYLFEREGTSCENLPETHEFLKKLRRHVDEKFKDRMLLAEANQWPEDAASYFGQGDECHMAFHFPIMPRLFMSIDMEDRFPIIDILQQTPAISEVNQWALFLRNHDELTLEMVTHEERDYMYRVYALDPKARINLGIRRRLAPLLQNHRRKIELMNGLLFSLPGTPIIYYGDEIGMGDNIYLGDRNGVRTPMQWSADKNAGFSRANPQKLYMPIIIDPEYHYEAFNVEGQQNNLRSLLWWMKRLIALRKKYKAFGRGSIEFLQPVNRKVLVYLRRYEHEQILVIANLSRFVDYVELDLSAYKGLVPMELFSRSKFPTIGELPYFITLGPHEFYMFILLEEKPASLQVISTANEAQKPLAVIEAEDQWAWTHRARAKEALEEILPEYFLTCRWFAGKAKRISAAKIVDTIAIPYKDMQAFMTIIRFEYGDAPAEQYMLPIAYAEGDKAKGLIQNSRQAVITTLLTKSNGNLEEGILYDALLEVDFAEALLSHIVNRRRVRGESGQITFLPTKILNKLYTPSDQQSYVPVLMKADQSNTSIKYDDHLILKIFRRLDQGISPDLEIGNFLTQKTSFAYVPPLAGYLEYSKGQTVVTLGILQGFVINQGDAWGYTLDEIGRFFEFMLEEKNNKKDVSIPSNNILDSLNEKFPDFVNEAIGPYLESIKLLGQRTAEMHIALSSVNEDPDFAPTPFSSQEQRNTYQSMYSMTGEVFRTFNKNLKNIPAASQAKAKKIFDLESKIHDFLKIILKQRFLSVRIRCHGDYHLGQVLCTGKDFVFTDFEGEPARSLSTRRLRQSPLKDVAGMLRSFHYAIRTGLHKFLSRESSSLDIAVSADHWARFWYHWVSVTFLKSYLEKTAPVPLFAKRDQEFETLLNVFMLEKAIYELNYELNNRPDWVDIPLDGILAIVEK